MPAVWAILHTEEMPFATLPAMSVVMSGSLCVTPCATTPLSAQSTITARFPISTSALPVSPAIFSTMSSSAPRLPIGLATAFHLSRAAFNALESSGFIVLAISCNWFSMA